MASLKSGPRMAVKMGFPDRDTKSRLYMGAHHPYLARSGGPEVLIKRC
jgi:hypothetical protein